MRRTNQLRYFMLILVFGICFKSDAIAQLKSNAVSVKAGYTFKGNIKGLKVPMVYLKPMFATGKIDSAKVSNGQFTFKGAIQSPVRYIVLAKDYSFKADFLLENSPITITGNFGGSYLVKGSLAQDEYLQFQALIQPYNTQAKQLEREMKQAKKSGKPVGEIDSLWTGITVAKLNTTLGFITQHPNSYVSLDQLAQLGNAQKIPFEQLQQIYAGLGSTIRSSAQGKEVGALIHQLSPVKEGYPAPQFSITDVEGQEVKLADYKGKYVLVDFWASWCAPCRAENPNVLKAYNKFHPKGLEILAVSLDEKRERWLKGIEEDKLPWKQVSDLKGFKSELVRLYKVNGIPANFLVDPNGNIVASELRGDRLEEALSVIFK